MQETKTDLERLHAVVSGETWRRGCGKTFAQCHAVASALELGEPGVLVAVPRYQWLEHVAPMLEGILVERGLGSPTRRRRLEWELPTGQTIRFVAAWDEGRIVGDRSAVVEVMA